MRRVYLRGHTNILKRLLIHIGGFNLGLLMRQLIGVGTPRGLQGRIVAVLGVLLTLSRGFGRFMTRHWTTRLFSTPAQLSIVRYDVADLCARETAFTTGC